MLSICGTSQKHTQQPPTPAEDTSVSQSLIHLPLLTVQINIIHLLTYGLTYGSAWFEPHEVKERAMQVDAEINNIYLKIKINRRGN